MTFDQYCEYDGTALAGLVRRGELTSRELVEAAIERIERHNPVVNAVVYKAYDEARAAADRVEGDKPFAGVPMLIKDLGLKVAGWPRTSGSRFTATMVDEDDSGLVRRYRASGAILLGRSATSEFGISGSTHTVAFGATRNPWNPEHMVGGSSGGAGAAVAAGIVPIAHGSDGLGSIRIPAACCGLVGLKPTRDRVPDYPDGADYAVGFVCDHVLTRTVRDSAAMLDATCMPEPGSPYASPPRNRPYAPAVDQSPGRLRIRWSLDAISRAAIDSEVAAVIEVTANTLALLGHDVAPGDLGVSLGEMNLARLPVSAANFAATMARVAAEMGRQPLDNELEPLTLAALQRSKQVPAEVAFYGLQQLRILGRRVLEQFETFDVFLCPVTTTLPPRIGVIDPLQTLPAEIDRLHTRLFPYASIFNFTGQPSMSLPLGHSVSGLPIGMMFTARYGDEESLFRLAGQLEKEIPWRDRRPPLWN